MGGLGLVGLMLALGAFAVFGVWSDDDDQYIDQDDTSPPDSSAQGTDGDDLIIARDGIGSYDGLGGDDTLLTEGDSTLMGGDGNDRLVSIGGGAVLNGGDDADTFVVGPLGVTDDGGLLNAAGQAVAPTVINDFNPDEDQLVLDLSESALVPADGGPVLLTGILAPDGEGLMVQVDGVNVVQLSTYGGGDMQAALEQLDVSVIGAAFEFPEEDDTPESPFPEGLTITEDADGNVVVALTDAFAGGGNYGGGDQFSTLDLSALTRDMQVTVLEGDVIVVEPADGSLPPVTFEEIDRVILGSGDDVFEGREGSGFVEAVAGNGADQITGSGNDVQNQLRGEGFMRSDGDTEVIDGTGATVLLGGVGNDSLSGGLGDTLTGGARSDVFVIYGVGDEGAGPARITDFNPLTNDRLVYTPVNPDGSDAAHDVVIQVEDFETSIIDNGEVAVVIQDIGRFYDPSIFITDPVTRLPV